ncbi:MAG: cytochrome c3 family protein [Acidobacteriota bacterium]
MMRLALYAFALAPLILGAESEIFAPTDKSVVAGEVRLIARHDGKAEFLIDGKAVAAESPHAGVMFATVKLAPGAHEIALAGGPKVRVHSGEGAPAGWQKFRMHPPGGVACTTCHAVRNGEWAFAKASLVGVCFACHDRAAFPKTHTHEPGIVPDCQMCHSPHGSTVARHLKMNRDTACKLCHN